MPKECIACTNETLGISCRKQHTCDVDSEVIEHKFQKSKILFESERGSRYKERNDHCKNCNTIKNIILRDGRPVEITYEKDGILSNNQPECN